MQARSKRVELLPLGVRRSVWVQVGTMQAYTDMS